MTTLLNEPWDYLIVLDACRFDYFEQMWKNYLPAGGQLKRIESPGSSTDEWRDNLFGGFYDNIVYITANPQINMSMPVYGYCAKEHFKFVHELWKDSWDSHWGTVLPESVTRRALEIIAQYPAGMRFVIHYLQPHAPYIHVPYDRPSEFEAFNRFLLNPNQPDPSRPVRSLLFGRLLPLFRRLYRRTNQPEWILRKLLWIPPRGPMEIAWRTLGTAGLKEAYKNNLKAVLEQVRILAQSLPGTLVITSDHGELLGEEGQFAHPRGSQHPILRNVPWLVIKTNTVRCPSEAGPPDQPKGSAAPQTETVKNEDEIIQRLRALGYYD
ncbi:MAG TPA: hypothetical protein PK052_11000 [Anaerohalosphaeraceae bacterium]|nr:hypothetical protein [Anaerohalosphaeraceae bacterium]HOL32496.1 hypothetical protein [Anaerohalosphaeraceae bacterium]HOM76204.1 hypothetical protein [Anaerohalosphaeraceae bacterium]HPC64061.1 hypothetical protein [Anaerohalosphaeraceae bacterium]HPO70778.1 hypothetical protein [Anaerohalosphaeraceae bacterium]